MVLWPTRARVLFELFYKFTLLVNQLSTQSGRSTVLLLSLSLEFCLTASYTYTQTKLAFPALTAEFCHLPAVRNIFCV